MDRICLFLGTERGLCVLESLIKNRLNIVGVVVLVQQSHELSNFTKEIIKLCKKNKISYETTETLKPKDYYNYLVKIKPDVVFAISWRNLISHDCYAVPSRGIYILHDSLLPEYRGFSPTNWVIINGEKETGLTLQTIADETDAGDIVDQLRVKISKHETATTLNEKFLTLYPKIILKNIDDILKGKIKPKPQNEKKASVGCKRIPEDGRIDFSRKTSVIDRLIRGLSYPYPGAFCFYNNKKVYVWKASPVKNPMKYVGRIPGRIASIKKEHVDVLTGDGILRIYQVSMDESIKDLVSASQVFKYFSVPII